MPGLYWQKRPQRTRTQDKDARADQRCTKLRRMAHVAETGAHGSENVFRRHGALLRSPLPAIDHNHHSQERNRIEQKDDSRSSGSDQNASEGGPTARETLTATPVRVTAAGISCRGTSS